MTIEITDKAKSKLREYQVGSHRFLRLGVVNGGCSGMTYDARIDEERQTADEVVFKEGDLEVVADSRSALYLDGLRVDFSDDLVQAGFRLTNRKARKSCGCGASFSV